MAKRFEFPKERTHRPAQARSIALAAQQAMTAAREAQKPSERAIHEQALALVPGLRAKLPPHVARSAEELYREARGMVTRAATAIAAEKTKAARADMDALRGYRAQLWDDERGLSLPPLVGAHERDWDPGRVVQLAELRQISRLLSTQLARQTLGPLSLREQFATLQAAERSGDLVLAREAEVAVAFALDHPTGSGTETALERKKLRADLEAWRDERVPEDTRALVTELDATIAELSRTETTLRGVAAAIAHVGGVSTDGPPIPLEAEAPEPVAVA